MPEEFFETVAHHLPPERPVGPRSGRPRVEHRIVLRALRAILHEAEEWPVTSSSVFAWDSPPLDDAFGRVQVARETVEAGVAFAEPSCPSRPSTSPCNWLRTAPILPRASARSVAAVSIVSSGLGPGRAGVDDHGLEC